MTITSDMLFPIEVWTQPEDKCFVILTLASGSEWLIPLAAVIDDAQRYYEHVGWDDEDDLAEGEKQPTGDELRGIMFANCDAEQWTREAYWENLREKSVRLSGTDEPPGDKIWAVEEDGGSIDLVTTLGPEEQKQSEYVLYASTDPATW